MQVLRLAGPIGDGEIVRRQAQPTHRKTYRAAHAADFPLFFRRPLPAHIKAEREEKYPLGLVRRC
jgi:hypothetical protein